MNIYIITQFLIGGSRGEDRLFKLGRECATRGHDVTLFTTSTAVDLDLGQKRIGLLHKEGLKVIAFNVPYDPEMSGSKKILSYLNFARISWIQGRQLPRPGLIIAASPPLTAALPALKLSKYYRVPLVMEIRELWPDALIQNKILLSKLLIKAARRLERDVYRKAGRIIADSQETAAAIKAQIVERSKVHVVDDQGPEQLLIDKYDLAFKGLIGAQ